jgi:glucose/mannose transport system substrate-binding protein
MILIKPSLKFFFILGLLPILISGCASLVPTEESMTLNSPVSPTEASSDRQLEIISVGWTTGGERDALEALVKVYQRQNPDIEVINAVDSGLSHPELVALLDERLQKQQPFDSWHVHPGEEVLDHVILGQVEPLTQLFKDQGLDRVMPQPLVEQITINGEIYSIPLNVHRSNVLWYNPGVFKANHLTPPETIEDFFKVAEALEDRGITPLALGGSLGFEVGHLFESVLLATFGPDDYIRLFQADTDMWEDPRTSSAIDTLQKMLAYTNDDHLEISWEAAAMRVVDGKAGMTIMGDWTEGYYKNQGALPNQDFGWAAAPGTVGTFIWLSDGFVLATGAVNREAGLAWIKVVGSKEGQDAFNPIKGSIPARTDADKNLYDEYLQWSIDQFASDILVPSVVHGAVGSKEYMFAYGDALDAFSKDLDAEKLLQSLKAAAALLEQ